MSKEINSYKYEQLNPSSSPFVFYDVGVRINVLIVQGSHLVIGSINKIIESSFELTKCCRFRKFIHTSIGPTYVKRKSPDGCYRNCTYVKEVFNIEVERLFVSPGNESSLYTTVSIWKDKWFGSIDSSKNRLEVPSRGDTELDTSRSPRYIHPVYNSKTKNFNKILSLREDKRSPLAYPSLCISKPYIDRPLQNYLVNNEQNESHRLDYLYEFIDQSSIYILKYEFRQRSDYQERVTKLIRLSPGHQSLFSFSEISLRCDGSSEAIAAHISGEKNNMIQIHSDDKMIPKTLFISFRSNKAASKSKVCSFLLTELSQNLKQIEFNQSPSATKDHF